MGKLCLKKVIKTERMVMKNCYYIDSRGPDGEQLQWAVKLFLSKIKVKSKTLHWVLSSIGFIKIPMPGLLIEKEKLRFIPICF